MPVGRIPRNLERERATRAMDRLAGERDPGALAAAVQSVLDCVPAPAHAEIAARAGTTEEAVRALVARSEGLRLEPPGAHRVTICTGRTCARRGGARLLRRARRLLGIGVFETSADGAVRLDPFRCFGQCAMAPNIRIDGGIRGAMTPERLELLLDMLRRRARQP